MIRCKRVFWCKRLFEICVWGVFCDRSLCISYIFAKANALWHFWKYLLCSCSYLSQDRVSWVYLPMV